MSNGRRRSPSLFSGIILVLFGVILLLHYFRGDFPLWDIFWRWWPALLILWGVVKLVERMTYRPAAAGAGAAAPRTVRGSEILLVLGLFALIGTIAGIEWVRRHAPDAEIPGILGANSYTYDIEVAPRPVPPNAQVTIRTTNGDITVRAENTTQLQVTAKKSVRAWDDKEAQRAAAPVNVVIEQTAGGFDVHPEGQSDNERVGVDIEARVPLLASLTLRNDHGDVKTTGLMGSLHVNNQRGDVEISDCAGVNVEMNRGDLKVSDAKGDVKITGNGDDVDVANAAGGMTLNGDFSGTIRAEKIAKGVHLVSQRADLTVSRLPGHLESELGDFKLYDATGNVSLRTSSKDITLENVTGKLAIENRAGNVELRFLQPPKDDITVSNESSGITVTLPANSSFEIQADSHSGEIESDFSGDALKLTKDAQGNSHLEGKVGTHGPKITLKTTYGSIVLRKAG
jgi:DUF4097 and DUF4098 domain-containing protein YvlB